MNLAYKEAHSELEEVIHNWVSWLRTRKYYGCALPMNILAQMQMDRRVLEPHDHKNDAMSASWNLVMSSSHALEPENFLPFMYVYLREYRPRPVKAMAYDLGIDRTTLYQRAHNAGPRYLYQAKKLLELNSKMQKEVAGYVD
jgi:heme/copper-type cytochrome/quinol oxidase subunit 1